MTTNKLRKIGWAIAMLNIFAMLNAMYFFLIMAKFPISAWIFLTACFTSSLIFLIGFFSTKKEIMAASIPFLAFFGFNGLFVFSWSGGMIMAQIGHIAMTLAILYIIIEAYKFKAWKQFLAGLIIGLIASFLIIPFQNNYVKNHPEYIKNSGIPNLKIL